MRVVRRLLDWTATACRQYADAVQPRRDPSWLRENLDRAEGHSFRLESELEAQRGLTGMFLRRKDELELEVRSLREQLERQRSCRCCCSRLIDEAMFSEDEGP